VSGGIPPSPSRRKRCSPPAGLWRRGLRALGASLIGFFALAHDASPQAAGLRSDVVFTQYSPLSSNAELVRRLVSPLTAAQLPAALARTGKVLADQPINLAHERFVVYAPPEAPPHGYGLLVFVPPWPEAQLPRGWAPVLDRSGVIFVSAARSGNEAEVLSRRAPLALLAWANVVARYRVDPDRVYVAGFSGGSRVALRLALAYPDVFRGALLNAGADPIGNDQAPLPPGDLFIRFQQSTRLVYVTGGEDAVSLGMDAASTQSMRDWCVFDVDAQVTRRVGHEAADSIAFARALAALTHPTRPDPGRLAACRSVIETRLTAQFQQVESLRAGGKRDEAQKLLIRIDRRFGGLAAPRSMDLAGQ
jgi:predicted esterase